MTADLMDKGGLSLLTECNAEPLNWPPFTECIRNESQKLFEACGPVYGLLEGDKARDAFLMFNMTPKDIWKIWDIADTHKRGALDRYDFALAFYLIQCVQTGQLSTIPATTPSQIYEQIRSASVSPKIPLPSPQILDTSVRSRKPIRPPPITTLSIPLEKSLLSAPAATNADSWGVSSSVKANAEQHFDKLDTLKVGHQRHSISAFKEGKEISSRSPAVLWDRQFIAIPPDVESPPVANCEFELRTVSLQQYRALEQQHNHLSSEVEKLSAQLSAQQDPFVASDHVSMEQYRLLKEKNSCLSVNIRELTSQIDTLRNVQSQNDTLSQDKARLLVQIREMEQITSDLLQSNEAISRVEQLEANNAKLKRRVSEVEKLRSQLNDATRRLNNALEESRNLRQRLHEARESVVTESRRAAIEVENMKKNMEILEKDKRGLQNRTETLQQVIMKAASNSKVIPEMEILMNDITRENESLKQRLRQVENSTANLLLSTNGHAEQESLRRVNRYLTSQIRDLEQLVAELQRSSEEVELQRVLKDVTTENDQLKGSLRETELEVTRLQQVARQVHPLEAKVEELQAEIQRLHNENLRAQTHAEESSVPPPAYDDDDTFH